MLHHSSWLDIHPHCRTAREQQYDFWKTKWLPALKAPLRELTFPERNRTKNHVGTNTNYPPIGELKNAVWKKSYMRVFFMLNSDFYAFSRIFSLNRSAFFTRASLHKLLFRGLQRISQVPGQEGLQETGYHGHKLKKIDFKYPLPCASDRWWSWSRAYCPHNGRCCQSVLLVWSRKYFLIRLRASADNPEEVQSLSLGACPERRVCLIKRSCFRYRRQNSHIIKCNRIPMRWKRGSFRSIDSEIILVVFLQLNIQWRMGPPISFRQTSLLQDTAGVAFLPYAG